MLLGWIAGQMAYTDIALQGIRPGGKVWEYTFAAVGAAIVWAIGTWLQKRAQRQETGN